LYRRALLSLAAAASLAASLSSTARAVPAVPSNFVVENAFPGVTFTVPTKIVWLPDGRALVAEKSGKVWAVKNGVKAAAPMVDISANVLNADDRGLLGLAVDPAYFVNHYIYLMHTVDPDSNGNENNTDAYSRVLRYTVNTTDSATVLAASRVVLIGSNWTNGIVSCSPSHTIGDLAFGADGSLFLSAGDGASFSVTDKGGLHSGCFGAGKTDPYEDIGAFRAQSLSSLAGKVLRIDPATGWGYPSNPYYDGNPQSKRSRVWVYGVRNPFRFTVRPGTGVADPAAGNPGTIFLGDVGYATWEEQNIIKTGGLNLGWPCYEGVGQMAAYQSTNPAHNGCGTMGTADNPTFQTSPTLAYYHATGTNSVPSYPGLWGNTAVGGAFYRSSLYPAQYRQQYFFGDYGQSWVRVATVDASSNLVTVSNFGTGMDSPVCFSTDPVGGDVLYVSITTGEIRRIRYTGSTGNANPIADAVATPTFGAAPLGVAFSSSGTIEPDGDPLTLSWSFGDVTGSTLANPTHTYITPGTYAAVLTATDGKGGVGRDTVVITATTVTNFPTTNVLDTFNRANGAIGAGWIVDKSGLVVSNNALTQTAGDNWGLWNANTFGPNQEAWITIKTLAANAPEHDLMLKVQGNSYLNGEIEVRYDDQQKAVYVSTYTPGFSWQARGAPIAVPFVSGDRLGARALADGTVEVYKNNALIGVRSVAGWQFAASGGRIGLTLAGATGALDDFGGGDVVFNTNTAPTVTVTSPTNRSFFIEGQSISLTGTASDAQDAAGLLAHHWDVELRHNTHIHFGLAFETPSASLVADNHDDGSGVFYRVKYRVTDTGGLVGRDSVDLFPEIDLNAGTPVLAPSAPTAADSITASFVIRNLGRLPSNFSRWRLVRGTTLLAEGDVIVPALDSVTITRKVGPFPAGTISVRAVADTLAQVTELLETNNSAMASIVVTPLPGNNSPIAAAAGTPLAGLAPLTVNFTSAGSSDPDNDALAFAWGFGDGGTGSGVTASRTYTSAGTYVALLTVTDGRGGSDTATVVINVTAPAAAFPTTPILDNFNRANGALGANWLNTTGLTITTNQVVPASGDYSPVWNAGVFGADQEAYVKFSTVSSNSPEHDLMLKVQGNTWDTGHIEVRYDCSKKRITVSTYTPGPGWVTYGATVSVTFVAGDRLGARARPNGVVEVWRNSTLLGTWSVAGWAYAANGGRIGLTLSKASQGRFDDFGGGTSTGGAVNSPPSAVAAGSPSTGVAPLTVNFSAAGSSDPDGDALTYAWAFGDATNGTGASVSHVYSAIGNYTATLTVSDGKGGTATANVAVSATSTAPSFPTTAVLDDFNRANGALGGLWVGTTTGLSVASNQLASSGSAATTVWSGATFGANQEAFVTLSAITAAAPEHDLMLKVQGLTWDTGHIEVRYEAPTSRLYVGTYSSSQGWVTRGVIITTYAAGDRLGARAKADGTVEVYRNSTLVGSASVAAWPFFAGGGGIGLTLDAASSSRLDDFGGGTWVAAAPAAATWAGGDESPNVGYVPGRLELSGAFPNPSTGGVQFRLALPEVARVSLTVYDLAGREVWSDGDRVMQPGRTTLEWNGRNRDGVLASAGMYMARVQVGERSLLRRLALLR